jgi:hypothetical protein
VDYFLSGSNAQLNTSLPLSIEVMG